MVAGNLGKDQDLDNGIQAPKDLQPNNPETNQQPTLTSNILPATITENKSLDAIFPFKLEELSTTPLFSEAALEKKPITIMYTDAKVDGHSIKLILDSRLAGSIIIKQLMDQLGHRVDCAASTRIITANGATKTSIGEINNFPIKINSIMVSIKVLVMEATQYQALIGNDWLFKTNALFDWNMQKLQISQNSQHTHIPATSVKHLDGCPHNDNKIWQMALAKIEGLAPTKKKQKQCLEEINTQLCNYCLIPCDFQYCNGCNLIYNSPLHMIYTILEEKKPISNCASESESIFNPDLNFDNNDDENNGSSFTQNGNENISNSDSDSNPKIYIYNDNNKNIILVCTHNTDAGFDLRYPEKEVIKLEPNLCTCIDLKIALEIPATIMIQLTSRSSLAKKGINIKGGIINAEYVRNIIAILQNNSEKTYIIEPNKKIAQAIFLPLVKIAQLVSMKNREELGIIAKGIQEFELTGRIDIPVNMVEKEAQLFEAEATICESGKIGLTNLYISAKSPKNIKIPIYNTTESVIEIPKRTIIGYLTTEVEDQPPNHIPDFQQLCRYVDITSQTIYEQSKCYLLQPEQLEQMNMGNLDPLQWMQLKMLLNNFNDIFASKNEFG
ncbi:hypothetical protein G9A89_017971 [Geosiphon pyriformis]|nr:hypothetical protein G9A89_017971 [Geosiphon pyriformis]